MCEGGETPLLTPLYLPSNIFTVIVVMVTHFTIKYICFDSSQAHLKYKIYLF
jgi:hypothetical protein